MELEGYPEHLRGLMALDRGTRLCARLQPHVVESPAGPVEVADLCFDDGTATRAVPFELFSFVNEG